jgi:hypothetical protein
MTPSRDTVTDTPPAEVLAGDPIVDAVLDVAIADLGAHVDAQVAALEAGEAPAGEVPVDLEAWLAAGYLTRAEAIAAGYTADDSPAGDGTFDSIGAWLAAGFLTADEAAAVRALEVEAAAEVTE